MHLTNLQLVLALFAISNLTVYLLGRRHGRAAVRLPEPPGRLAVGSRQIRRRK